MEPKFDAPSGTSLEEAQQPEPKTTVQPEPTVPATPPMVAETPAPEIETIKKKEVQVEPPPVTSTTPSLETEQPVVEVKEQSTFTSQPEAYHLEVKTEQVKPENKPFTQSKPPEPEDGKAEQTLLPNIEAEPYQTSDFSAEVTYDRWQHYGEKVADFIDRLPTYTSRFFGEYQRPLTVVGVILGAFIALRLLIGLLDTIEELPLLKSFFQLIGVSYAGWFVYRYLLRVENRQELYRLIDDYKAQVLGTNNSESK